MIQMKATRASTQFWIWFARNSERFLHLHHVRTKKEFVFWFDELQMHAIAFCKLLTVVYYVSKKGKGQLTITANGNPGGFKKADQLVRCAPELKNWEIVSLHQPKPFDKVIEWIGPRGDIDPAKIWFQCEKASIPGIQPIRVYMEYILPGREWDMRELALLMIEHLVGERATALNIELLEVDSRCNASKKQRLRPLAELPEVIEALTSVVKVSADGSLTVHHNEP